MQFMPINIVVENKTIYVKQPDFILEDVATLTDKSKCLDTTDFCMVSEFVPCNIFIKKCAILHKKK